VYFADHWKAYAELIPKICWFKLRRRCMGGVGYFLVAALVCVVLQKDLFVFCSLQMVDLTLSLYAKFWVNGTFNATTLFS